jgi:1,3-beta-glucan synthase
MVQFLWFIEAWKIQNAVLGMIAVVAVQRWFFKLLISVFLTREYKHDQTNKAWWTGNLVQLKAGLFREYVVKIVETSLFAADFLT